MADRKYSEDHEWVEVDGETGTIGISDYAQEQLGDVVFVELPEVIEVNDALNGDPSLVNTDAFGDGWFAKLRLTDPAELDELMDEAAYKTFCEGLG